MRSTLLMAVVAGSVAAIIAGGCSASDAVDPHSQTTSLTPVAVEICPITDPSCVPPPPTPPPSLPNLLVSIDHPGGAWVSTPGDSMFFTANVSNSATAHHYYYWFERNCWSDSGCQDEFQPIASGQDVSHISRTFGTLLAYKEVAVEVKDYPVTVYCTGASDTLKILGPAINDAFPGSPVGCGFSGQFYPFDQFKWTDSSGYVATGRRYRWDVCTNKKVFDPSTPES